LGFADQVLKGFVQVVNAVSDRVRAELLRRIGLGDLLAPRKVLSRVRAEKADTPS